MLLAERAVFAEYEDACPPFMRRVAEATWAVTTFALAAVAAAEHNRIDWRRNMTH